MQAKSMKSVILGKWELEKIAYLNRQGNPDNRRTTIIPKIKAILHFVFSRKTKSAST